MKAVVWQGKRDVRVEQVPDPVIQEPTDAIVRVTTTNICGSDLHLYETLGAFMDKGDVLGHESMGVVEEVGTQAGDLKVGDRVVMPFDVVLRAALGADAHVVVVAGEAPAAPKDGLGALLRFESRPQRPPSGSAS